MGLSRNMMSLRYVEQQIPGEHEMQRSRGLFCVSISQGAAFTVNMEWGILTSPPSSVKSSLL